MRTMTTDNGEILVSFTRLDGIQLAGILRRAADVRQGKPQDSWPDLTDLDADAMRELAGLIDPTGRK